MGGPLTPAAMPCYTAPEMAPSIAPTPASESRPLRCSGTRFFKRYRRTPLAEYLPDADLRAFSREQINFAVRAWTMRAEEEHHSAATFADALSLLTDADAPLDFLAHLTRIVGDEIEHATLCTHLARRLRSEEPRSRPLARRSVASSVAARRAQGLALVLASGAVGETISAALFRSGHRSTEEPCAKAALGLILRDEVLHARAFWESLAVLLVDLAPEELETLQSTASRALGSLEHKIALPALQRLERGDPFDPAWAALGVLRPDRRADAFYATVERHVLPKLSALGLSGDAAWRDRYDRR